MLLAFLYWQVASPSTCALTFIQKKELWAFLQIRIHENYLRRGFVHDPISVVYSASLQPY